MPLYILGGRQSGKTFALCCLAEKFNLTVVVPYFMRKKIIEKDFPKVKILTAQEMFSSKGEGKRFAIDEILDCKHTLKALRIKQDRMIHIDAVSGNPCDAHLIQKQVRKWHIE